MRYMTIWHSIKTDYSCYKLLLNKYDMCFYYSHSLVLIVVLAVYIVSMMNCESVSQCQIYAQIKCSRGIANRDLFFTIDICHH